MDNKGKRAKGEWAKGVSYYGRAVFMHWYYVK